MCSVQVEIPCLYKVRRFETTDRIMPPEKWLDYVIFYALEERYVEIKDDNIFLGIALYAQDILLEDSYRDTLLDNMLNLYIKRSILSDDKSSFYDKIYTTKDEQELALLEQLMKEVLLRVLKIQRIPFSFEHGEEGDTNLRIHERTTCRLDGFCRKRSLSVSENNDAISFDNVSFDNVIMDREPLTIMPLEIIDKDYRKILLVGMCEEEGVLRVQ